MRLCILCNCNKYYRTVQQVVVSAYNNIPHIYIYIYIRLSRFIIFDKLIYYFGHIIMFGIEFGNMSMFQIMRFVRVLQLLYCFSYTNKCNLDLVNKSVYQILKFLYTTEINNKWKPQYYYSLYMIYNTLM